MKSLRTISKLRHITAAVSLIMFFGTIFLFILFRGSQIYLFMFENWYCFAIVILVYAILECAEDYLSQHLSKLA